MEDSDTNPITTQPTQGNFRGTQYVNRDEESKIRRNESLEQTKLAL